MGKKVVAVAAAVLSAVGAYQLAYKPWKRRWEASPEESVRAAPGDDLVPDADFVQTMALTIETQPAAIWPWLVQLGYGRGGWYSYDVIDMRGHSAHEIVPELQDVEVGQLIPVAPGVGFRLEVLQPERALVLYADNELFEGRSPGGDAGAPRAEEGHASFKVLDALYEGNMSAFRMSWAFVLDPVDDGRTRLLERFRAWSAPGPAAVIVGPLMDVGHFLMTRKQMLGIKERAERTGRRAPITAEATLVLAS